MRTRIVLLYFPLLLVAETIITVSSFSASPSALWTPCTVDLCEVSQQYPVTFWRKLTSSEPRREYAIKNLSISLCSSDGLTLLLGASSSGKSTILRLLTGKESPISGTLEISLMDDDIVIAPALPVMLEERPVYSNKPKSTRDILTSKILELVSKSSRARTLIYESSLLQDLSNILDLPLDKSGVDLSPSEAYRCCIGEACLQSMLQNQEDDFIKHGLPAPILLLDEWMDKETSEVIQKVQSSLSRLVNKGAIVASITHKPQLYKMEESMRRITLRSGVVASDTCNSGGNENSDYC